MAGKCAEDFIRHCHRCGGGEQKDLVITPKRSAPMSHWALCPICFEAEGGVWWVGKIPKYEVTREKE
jgi:hypothetical protein